MKKLSLILVFGVILALFALAQPAGTWKWRTHGGVYGTQGISKVAYDRIAGDPGIPQYVKDNLKWDLIRAGSVKPDTWRQSPYFLDSKHVMTYTENQGAEWLLRAENARLEGAPDNVSYYLGIASHYWADVTQYAHHDNARKYYEDIIPDPDAAYQAWDAVHDHLEWQVEYYRPQDPALIGENVNGNIQPYGNLVNFLDNARVRIYEFRDNTMPPGDPMGGWFGDWIRTRKAENFGVQEGIDPPYGTKDCVDMATELIYSGWIYALGVQNGMPTINWEQWWSRSHREPGVVFYSYG